ncbi:MAG: hypothetical protein DME09_16170 [Candidatus Rokuibacteriota bacterium]|nr:MAG: hypothetical protein DME09_16170 [Candidatus Rokubacteria bacterium]
MAVLACPPPTPPSSPPGLSDGDGSSHGGQVNSSGAAAARLSGRPGPGIVGGTSTRGRAAVFPPRAARFPPVSARGGEEIGGLDAARGEDDMAQLRTPLDAKRFAAGLTWKDYMAQMGDTRARTEDNYQKAVLTEEERRFFSGLGQVRYALMLAENWCGDVHRNSPVLARIVEALPACDLRVLFRDQNLDLTDCFLNNGYRSIPVLVFYDKDWNELGRWIERPAAATQRMLGIRAKTLDAAPPDQQDAAMTEFRKQFQAAYDTAPDKSLWRDAVREVRQVLETRLGLATKK